MAWNTGVLEMDSKAASCVMSRSVGEEMCPTGEEDFCDDDIEID
jgi:hypothetical protein